MTVARHRSFRFSWHLRLGPSRQSTSNCDGDVFELDRVALAHSAFREDALSLIVRSSEGILRAARNLCVGALLETVRDRTKTVGLKQVNRVLMQPHWRHEREVE